MKIEVFFAMGALSNFDDFLGILFRRKTLSQKIEPVVPIKNFFFKFTHNLSGVIHKETILTLALVFWKISLFEQGRPKHVFQNV